MSHTNTCSLALKCHTGRGLWVRSVAAASAVPLLGRSRHLCKESSYNGRWPRAFFEACLRKKARMHRRNAIVRTLKESQVVLHQPQAAVSPKDGCGICVQIVCSQPVRSVFLGVPALRTVSSDLAMRQPPLIVGLAAQCRLLPTS